MATLARFGINWSGNGVNGSAQSHLYFLLSGNGIPGEVINPIAEGLRSVLSNRLSQFLPASVSVQVAPTVDALDVPTGQIVLSASQSGGGGPVPGTDTTSFSSASGAVLTLNTATIRNGRRVRGRWFWVPLGGSAYDTGGTLAGGLLTTAATVSNDLTGIGSGSSPLVVYSRPTPGGSNGATAQVTSCTMRDKVAILRSRRD
jgi:hypothetical protein